MNGLDLVMVLSPLWGGGGSSCINLIHSQIQWGCTYRAVSSWFHLISPLSLHVTDSTLLNELTHADSGQGEAGGNKEKDSLCNPPVRLWPSIMAVRAAVLLLFGGSSRRSAVSFGSVIKVQTSTAAAEIKDGAVCKVNAAKYQLP